MEYIERLCSDAKNAAAFLRGADTNTKNAALKRMAEALRGEKARILKANETDIKNFPREKNSAFLDRLTLNGKRIEAMAEGIEAVIRLEDPVGKITGDKSLKNGLRIQKVRAPLGVIAIIYEARPNVTADAAALCLKSGNACVLRGGKEAIETNKAIYSIMKEALNGNSFSKCMQLIERSGREYVLELLKADKYIDVVIPRGGPALKELVKDNAKMPAIYSEGGICHVYVEKSADMGMASDIIFNAKTSRPGVCNAAETLLVDAAAAEEFLPKALLRLREAGVEIRGCNRTRQLFSEALPVENYDTEYESMILAVKVVEGVKEAIAHINLHNTKHSDAVVTNDESVKRAFSEQVDAAAVYINASTRFTDGFEFGLGAEMAISTQKLHARGPIGLEALTSEKYVVTGNGNIRL